MAEYFAYYSLQLFLDYNDANVQELIYCKKNDTPLSSWKEFCLLYLFVFLLLAYPPTLLTPNKVTNLTKLKLISQISLCTAIDSDLSIVFITYILYVSES
ncbi:hypothetical protein VPH35_028723 [Triticum aestivum]